MNNIKCVCCKHILTKDFEFGICKECRTTKSISGNNAVKKYKITKTDIYDYFHGDRAEKHFIYAYRYNEKFLISDIEKIAEKKHTSLDGIRFLENIKRNDEIDNKIKKIHALFPAKVHEINEMKKTLVKNKELTVDKILDTIKERFKTEQKIESIINNSILNSLCIEKAIIKECGVTKTDYDLLKKYRDVDIFDELCNTYKYKKFMENFNYEQFNEITIKKINFIEIFLDDVKKIVQELLDEVHHTIRKKEFSSIVAKLVGDRKIYSQHLSEFDKIKNNYMSNEFSKEQVLQSLGKMCEEIDEEERKIKSIELRKEIFSMFIRQYRYGTNEIVKLCEQNFLNDLITLKEMEAIAQKINDEYSGIIKSEFGKRYNEINNRKF
jgi:hypothetical protein